MAQFPHFGFPHYQQREGLVPATLLKNRPFSTPLGWLPITQRLFQRQRPTGAVFFSCGFFGPGPFENRSGFGTISISREASSSARSGSGSWEARPSRSHPEAFWAFWVLSGGTLFTCKIGRECGGMNRFWGFPNAGHQLGMVGSFHFAFPVEHQLA